MYANRPFSGEDWEDWIIAPPHLRSYPELCGDSYGESFRVEPIKNCSFFSYRIQ